MRQMYTDILLKNEVSLIKIAVFIKNDKDMCLCALC